MPPWLRPWFLARTTESKAAIEEAVNSTNWLHNMASLTPPTSDGAVVAVAEGLRCTLAKPVVNKEPVSVADLQKIVEQADMMSLMDVRIVAICLLSFTVFLRYDEMAELR